MAVTGVGCGGGVSKWERVPAGMGTVSPIDQRCEKCVEKSLSFFISPCPVTLEKSGGRVCLLLSRICSCDWGRERWAWCQLQQGWALGDPSAHKGAAHRALPAVSSGASECAHGVTFPAFLSVPPSSKVKTLSPVASGNDEHLYMDLVDGILLNQVMSEM